MLVSKLDNTRICKHLRGIQPEQFKVVKNLCDTRSKACDNRRLFLAMAYIHFLYESSHTNLLTKPSNINLGDIDFCISFIWYRLTVHDLNVIFYLILDTVVLYYPSCISFSFGSCCDGIESAIVYGSYQ